MTLCASRHRPGARWFAGEDRTVSCDRRVPHEGWHRFDGFEWDDEHAVEEPVDARTGKEA
jgi:hypothetical protein